MNVRTEQSAELSRRGADFSEPSLGFRGLGV